jgi:uncharacterized membrane protein YsdA (DUF1294 family)/cold shock CspA family protein
MRKKGKIRSWNDQRGFGFIESSEGGKDVFLHISALGNRNRRPEIGQYVTYTLSTDKQGRAQAFKAALPGDRLPRSRRKTGLAGAIMTASAFLALVFFSVLAHKIPTMILWGYLAMSMITFLMYAFDKTAAKDGAQRTPESMLHWLSVIGGWPGALIAQQSLRHKSRKQPFRMVFWMTVFVNCSVFAWLLTPDGSGVIQSLSNDDYGIFSSQQTGTIEWSE